MESICMGSTIISHAFQQEARMARLDVFRYDMA